MIGLKYLYAMLAGAFSGQPALNLRGRRPTGPDLRNPADPVQARRIEAAVAKRARRAGKLNWDTSMSVRNNQTTISWYGAFPDRACRANLNPFYVAK